MTGYQSKKAAAQDKLAQPEQEQEPVAWQWLGSAHFRKKLPKNADITAWNPLYIAPPAAQPKHYRHTWGKDGERCVVCGDKDWMGTSCKKISAPAAQPNDPTGQVPCVRHCESTAYEIVIRGLKGDIERMKAAQRPWVGSGDVEDSNAYQTPLAQPEQERNFCPRCGKRTNDIHICTPPQEST